MSENDNLNATSIVSDWLINVHRTTPKKRMLSGLIDLIAKQHLTCHLVITPSDSRPATDRHFENGLETDAKPGPDEQVTGGYHVSEAKDGSPIFIVITKLVKLDEDPVFA